MRNYLKKKQTKTVLELTAEELISQINGKKVNFPKLVMLSLIAICISVPVVHSFLSFDKLNTLVENDTEMFSLNSAPLAATDARKDLISIPSGTVKANPFLPYRDIDGSLSQSNVVMDVPKFDLLDPPDIININSDAAKVMDTVVSGILYDKYSPSAILKIEGNDYLVKKGDVINNYKIVSIMQDNVTVKLGNNTYKAGIGEILTEGSVNYNDVSNLSKKFGGDRR